MPVAASRPTLGRLGSARLGRTTPLLLGSFLPSRCGGSGRRRRLAVCRRRLLGPAGLLGASSGSGAGNRWLCPGCKQAGRAPSPRQHAAGAAKRSPQYKLHIAPRRANLTTNRMTVAGRQTKSSDQDGSPSPVHLNNRVQRMWLSVSFVQGSILRRKPREQFPLCFAAFPCTCSGRSRRRPLLLQDASSAMLRLARVDSTVCHDVEGALMLWQQGGQRFPSAARFGAEWVAPPTAGSAPGHQLSCEAGRRRKTNLEMCCVASLPLHCSGPASARFAPSGLLAFYRLMVHRLHAGEAC